MTLGPVRVMGAGVVMKQYAPEVSNYMQHLAIIMDLQCIIVVCSYVTDQNIKFKDPFIESCKVKH